MSDQMTLSAGADRHPNFDHLAVYHDGDDDLAALLTPEIARALGDGDAVLVCSPRPVWQLISSQLGSASKDVEYVPDDVRYDHPNLAMRILHDFVRDRTRAGARATCSIGAIPLDVDLIRVADWMRYERAVNDVLQHLPLRAVCTYDLATTPSELLDHARCVHSSGHADSQAQLDREPEHSVPPIELPTPEPLLRLDVHGSRSARQTVVAAYADVLDDDARRDLALIVSELVSNALNYGSPPVTLSAWYDAATNTSVLDVSDHGHGIDDPFVDLRPPRKRAGGAGMWIVGQLSERLTSQRVDGVHHVTALLRHRPQSNA